MLAYVRRTPIAFWLALLGIAFYVAVFVTRFWDFQSGFAVILTAGFFFVALLTAIHDRGAWIGALSVAILITVVEAGLSILFLIPSPDGWLIGVAISHLAGVILAGTAALTLGAVIRGAPGPRVVSRPLGS